MADNTTQVRIVSASGTGFTVDVTICNLTPSIAVKDFEVFDDGVLMNNTDWVKTSQTQLQYTGTAIPSSTITVKRRTLIQRVQELVYGSRLNTPNYEAELNTIHRVLNDLRVANSSSFLPPTVIDQTYGVAWSADTVNGPSRKSVYDKFVLVDAKDTAQDGLITTANTNIGTLQGNVNTLSTNKVDINGNGGTLSATTPSLHTNSTRVATMAALQTARRPIVVATVPGNQSIPASTITTLQFTNETSDLDNTWATDTFTVPTGAGGLYMVSITGLTVSPQTAQYIVYYQLNAGTNVIAKALFAATDLFSADVTTFPVLLVPGDLLRIRFQQTKVSPSASTVTAGTLTIYKIGTLS